MKRDITKIQELLIQKQDRLITLLSDNFNKNDNEINNLTNEVNALHRNVLKIKEEQDSSLLDFKIENYNENFEQRCISLQSIHERKKAFILSVINKFDREHDQDEKERLYGDFKRRIASFGGEISGIIRQDKSELSILIFNQYVHSNNIDLSKLSIISLKRFFKMIFKVSPTDKTLSKLIKNDRVGGPALSNDFILSQFKMTPEDVDNSILEIEFKDKSNKLSKYNDELKVKYRDLYNEVKTKIESK
ncbi:hypothetical protein HWA77_22120 [Photobacterium damselae subsp. damselae]|uniref:Uncharacterized protein n=1 Tax=Photobacterium damselae subsp. damselae TaxID=85581 RepID=A0A850R645_PHODD|nr:hypothetical protein [Photobacterium damselae subsp. damselae]